MKASETLRAPAKLNLTLEVLSRRTGGLHAMRSVMVPVDLYDEILVETAQRFHFSCDVPDLQTDNLVVRALTEINGGKEPPMHVHLRKRIPTAAVMGGGSSDAAAVLLTAQRRVATHSSLDLVSVAQSLGSDVPFFLVRTAALVEGTGERVTALGAVPPWHAVVIKPPAGVSTRLAYEQIDAVQRASRPRGSSISLQMCEAFQRGEFQRVIALLHNDFQDAVAPLSPQIGQAVDLLRAAGATHAAMTGSGSCVFALSETVHQRDALARAITLPEGYRMYPCSFWSGQEWRSAA
jgi:4-diphosphocytidyl-2-C-methyl-D-erythritol kinase